MEVLRAVVRPVLALITTAATVTMLLLGIEIPEAWWAIQAAVITFYFTQRHEEKLRRVSQERRE